MHVLEVVPPVDHARVEGEVPAVLAGQRLVQGEHPIVGVDDLDLDVRAVQVGVAPDEVQAASFPVNATDQFADAIRTGQPRDQTLGRVEQLLPGPELAFDLSSPGKPPLRDADLASASLGKRMPLEVRADVLIELHVGQGVPGTRGDVVVRGAAFRFRWVRRHRQHRVYHEVDGDQVDDAFRETGELGNGTAPVGQDDRLRHLEALDPPGVGMPEGALDDRWANDRQGEPVLCGQLLRGALAERLRERVHVRPPQGLSPGSSVLHEAGVHPLPSVLLGCRRHGDRPGPAVLDARLVDESVEHLGLARGVLDLSPGRRGGLGLGPPVDPMLEGGLGHHALGHPGHVGGRDVHEMRPAATRRHGLVHVGGPKQVDGEGLVDRWVEGHGGRAVEDEVEVGRKIRNAFRHVPFQDRDGLAQQPLQAVRPDAFSQLAEAVAGQDLLDPGDRWTAVASANEERDARVWELGEESFEEGGLEESGDAGDEDVLARQ